MAKALDIAYAGTPDLAAHILKTLLEKGTHRISLVYTRPDLPAGRGRRLREGPVKQLAISRGLPVLQPSQKADIDPDGHLVDFDLMVVAAYGMILPEAILNRPRLGCINVHTSLLPRWRGAAPIQRAILAGDAETGITIMQMDAGLDTGPILYQRALPIQPEDTAGSLHDRLAILGGECLLASLDQLSAGSALPEPQPDTGVTYADKIRKEEALLDWSRPAVEIERRVRAFNPAPVARAVVAGIEFRVWRAEVLKDQNAATAPGSVAGYSAAGLDVATGNGVLRVVQLQLPGKKVLDCRDFYNGNPRLWR